MKARKYISSYSEPETDLFNSDFPNIYHHCLCIPAYNEDPDFITNISTIAKSSEKNILLILVINQPHTVEHCQANIDLAQTIATGSLLWQQDNCKLYQHNEMDILLVDRFSKDHRIHDKEGVGTARKVACDIACQLYLSRRLLSKTIFCSDADVIFPQDYFEISTDNKYSAMVYAFEHLPSGNHDVDLATTVYEQSLNHYLQGLHYANSIYAYHAIGSCLAIDIDYYLKARGFPKRSAGEDFYLLNKLNKLAPVKQIDKPVLGIQSRQSVRTPFGTGPAVKKILEQGINISPIFYHPECFTILKKWLDAVDEYCENGALRLEDYKLEALAQEFGIEEIARKIFTNHKSIAARKQHMHHWFDAFKTLKLIHYCRDHYFPSLSYNEFINIYKKNV